MKNYVVWGVLSLFVLTSCKDDKPVVPDDYLTSHIDKDQVSTKLMNDLVPQLRGKWLIKQLKVKPRNDTFHSEIGIKKDTVLTDFAKLTLAPSTVQYFQTSTQYEGHIEFAGKTYPIRFELRATSNWIFSNEIPQAFFLLEYNFPDGYSAVTTKEQYYLQQIGLLLDNFTLETTIGQTQMTWRGLNRGIDQVILVKQ
ncbi:hypothetical protein [Siphonobacter curvatus]|uniref:Uncharacterized protein n=1 Tax=Siphonobacter curvatus TaxID=2094562 RepID=A0A2S7IK13_9BACT|nr:hypothetical protein [Siphonobacter curvatus]PQA56846.1 hypothetical protein C5O19_16040 [Siphonobacter curvatus]